MRRTLILFVILAMISSVAGQVYYSIDTTEDSYIMNTSVKLTCDPNNCPVNSWSLILNRPENSEVLSVKSSNGEVSDYSVNGDKLSVTTNSDIASEEQLISVSYLIDESAKNIEEDLYVRKISLPGFSGESNYGQAHAEDMVGASITPSFGFSIENNTLTFRGDGPGNIDVVFGDGYSTTYYEFFGAEPEDTELAYKVAIGTLGFAQSFERLPAAVLDNRKYNETVNEWSAGRYIDGTIMMREGLEEDFVPVLAHETVHALNDQRLKDTTSSSWFDEGVSKYVEFLMRSKLWADKPTRQLFGEQVSYVENTDDGRYQYTYPSKGNREQLWQYYKDDRDFMKSWNSDSSNRAFGYAYSELVIRNYVANGGKLSDLYREIGNHSFESNEQKWSLMSNYLDLTPCDYESRNKFDSCLDEINSYNYPVYSAEPVRSGKQLEVKELEVAKPENKSHGTTFNQTGTSEEVPTILDFIVNALNSLIRNLEASF